MAAIDGVYQPEEKELLYEMATILGLDTETIDQLDIYVQHLVDEVHEWETITSSFHSQEYIIINKLKKEYSEGSVWHKLGLAYLNGTAIDGLSVPANPKRAEQCIAKAKALGYEP